jgi:hypothetical protein
LRRRNEGVPDGQRNAAGAAYLAVRHARTLVSRPVEHQPPWGAGGRNSSLACYFAGPSAGISCGVSVISLLAPSPVAASTSSCDLPTDLSMENGTLGLTHMSVSYFALWKCFALNEPAGTLTFS